MYSILKAMLEKAGMYKQSYVRQLPIYEEAKQLDLSFPGQADIDVLDIEKGGYSWRISSAFRGKIEDFEDYLSKTDLVWTHSTYCPRTAKTIEQFEKVIYICRDPRDVALSQSHFLLTDYMKSFYENDFGDAQQTVNQILDQQLDQWAYHVGHHLQFLAKPHVKWVFFEQLKQAPYQQIREINEFLETGLSDLQIQEIVDATSFSSMKKDNPKHLRKGSSGGWRKNLSPDLQAQTHAHIGLLLEALNYPIDPEVTTLPTTPSHIDPTALAKLLKKVEKRVVRRKYSHFVQRNLKRLGLKN